MLYGLDRLARRDGRCLAQPIPTSLASKKHSLRSSPIKIYFIYISKLPVWRNVERFNVYAEQQHAPCAVRPFIGPPDVRFSSSDHDGGLAAPPGLCNAICTLYPIAE